MTEQELTSLHSKIDAGVKAAIASALEEHRKLGHSISIWRNAQVITLPADQILPTVVNQGEISRKVEE